MAAVQAGHPLPSAAKAASRWAHARHKLHEAAESAPQHAGWLLLHIQHLYRIEHQLRMSRAGPQQRQAMRASHSRMITTRIHRAITRMKRCGRHLPKSPSSFFGPLAVKSPPPAPAPQGVSHRVAQNEKPDHQSSAHHG